MKREMCVDLKNDWERRKEMRVGVFDFRVSLGLPRFSCVMECVL